jgi:hypothetical protein
MAYLLDSNVFIQAKNLHYGFDFCPAFCRRYIAGDDAIKVWINIAAARKATILAQVDHFYFGDPGHIAIGGDSWRSR